MDPVQKGPMQRSSTSSTTVCLICSHSLESESAEKSLAKKSLEDGLGLEKCLPPGQISPHNMEHSQILRCRLIFTLQQQHVILYGKGQLKPRSILVIISLNFLVRYCAKIIFKNYFIEKISSIVNSASRIIMGFFVFVISQANRFPVSALNSLKKITPRNLTNQFLRTTAQERLFTLIFFPFHNSAVGMNLYMMNMIRTTFLAKAFG